ncbi:hypothetical protein [Wenjunlia tyrosinilytica]|uniref:hypothetical protein n=1 Tax=Wenjunlia tyrosinilytica TaxID=1544741 RepID=UPI00166C565D|nr:hypothetical protein [Wenjunlia tyrosinilytica]
MQAAAQAGLVVVGPRVHRPTLGMRIGPVTHAVPHHAAAPSRSSRTTEGRIPHVPGAEPRRPLVAAT